MPSLKDLESMPRVPRTDDSGRQIGVGIPPHKVAISYGKPVDMTEAVANLNARLRGEKPRIAGGIDDTDPALYVVPAKASPFEKMDVAQRGALTQEQVMALKAASASRRGDEPPTADMRPQDAVPSVGGPAWRPKAAAPEPPEPAAVPAPEEPVDPAAQDRPKRRRSQPQVQERVVEVVKEVPVYRDVEKVVEKEVVKPGPFEEWSKKRVRVQIGTKETTFNVSAVAVLRSVHGLTVILPTANDAMTFVPRTGASVSLAFRDEAVDTIFTGVSFEIEELSIMGLCFLRNKKPDAANP